jgi:hypothetical protein
MTSTQRAEVSVVGMCAKEKFKVPQRDSAHSLMLKPLTLLLTPNAQQLWVGVFWSSQNTQTILILL